MLGGNLMDSQTIDPADLRSLIADVDPAILQLLPSYVANRHADLEVLDRSIAENDMTRLRRLGHNLKGSGAAYGLPPVSELGAGIEDAAKREAIGDLKELRGELEQLVMNLDAVLVDAQ